MHSPATWISRGRRSTAAIIDRTDEAAAAASFSSRLFSRALHPSLLVPLRPTFVPSGAIDNPIGDAPVSIRPTPRPHPRNPPVQLFQAGHWEQNTERRQRELEKTQVHAPQKRTGERMDALIRRGELDAEEKALLSRRKGFEVGLELSRLLTFEPLLASLWRKWS